MYYYHLSFTRECASHLSLEWAIQELLANALDASPSGELPAIEDGSIIDKGPGIELDHFNDGPSSSRENENKRGLFGSGMKDAIAILRREGYEISFESKHGNFQVLEASNPSHPNFRKPTICIAVAGTIRPRKMIETKVTIRGGKVNIQPILRLAANRFVEWKQPKPVVLFNSKNGQVLAIS